MAATGGWLQWLWPPGWFHLAADLWAPGSLMLPGCIYYLTFLAFCRLCLPCLPGEMMAQLSAQRQELRRMSLELAGSQQVQLACTGVLACAAARACVGGLEHPA